MTVIETSYGKVFSEKVKLYLVGGAVRDKLLKIEPKDNDYVIVGADAMFAKQLLTIGFEQVGADFPVYLHPDTKDEYAFARQERKVGVGYNGFETITSPDLTIEDDLVRRDLTINSIAIDLDTQELIDPFNGISDLRDGVIRHTSEAFSEDPLRVLRVARFMARYNFTIATETHLLIDQLVKLGELKHLVQERVNVEFEKIFCEPHAAEALKILANAGVLKDIHPKFEKINDDDLEVFKTLVKNQSNHAVKFASIGHHFSDKDLRFLRVSSYTEKLTLTYAKIKHDLLRWSSLYKVYRRELLLMMKVLQNEASLLPHLIELCNAHKSFSKDEEAALMRDVNALRAIDNVELLNGVNKDKIAAVIKEKHLAVLA